MRKEKCDMTVFEKINTEMQKDPANKYLEIIGHYVLDRCVDEACEKKASDEKKTLAGTMQEILKEAGRKKQGNVAVLLPADVFGTVDKYFGFATDVAAQAAAMSGAAPAPKPAAGNIVDLSSFF